MKSYFEPFKIKAIEEIPITTRREREKYIKEANYNPFS
jgi:tryptophanase